MNFLNDSIPRAQAACLPPQLCTKLGHSFPHLLPKLKRLTHTSREDLFPIQDQAASQKTSGFLPASETRPGTTSISPITSFPTGDLNTLASDESFRIYQTDSEGRQAKGSLIAFPAQTQNVEREQGQQVSSFRCWTQSFAFAIQAGKLEALKTGQKWRADRVCLTAQVSGGGLYRITGFPSLQIPVTPPKCILQTVCNCLR